VGRFEAATGGALFLDGVTCCRSKLSCSALQNRQVVPVGSNVPVPVDIRLLSAATPVACLGSARGLSPGFDVPPAVQKSLPPLRERADDVELLAQHFAQVYHHS
jgi:transcriptional regulator with GAF, ATPase, and Fis domain